MAKRTTLNKKKLRREARAKAFQTGGTVAPEPVRFSMMAKPIGPACNLRCEYCFYLEKEALLEQDGHRMSDEVLATYVQKYLESQPGRQPVAFHWQGGEPTLLGPDFFRRAVEIQNQHANGRAFTNTIQTNGTLLDDDWGRFLSKNRWTVGLSLDGPKDIHDSYRLDTRGEGSFDAVIRGLGVLQKHDVEYNLLASVTPASTGRPVEVYDFLKNTGAKFLQFMPIVERFPDQAAESLGLKLAVGIRAGERLDTVKMTPWSVDPKAYGEFLCQVFDRWFRQDVGRLTVMNFEWAFANYTRQPAAVCQWMPVCGRSPIIEYNGDVYACDHYMYPEYRLGNILTGNLQAMIQSPKQCTFGQTKLDALPKYCRQCPVGPMCWGECPKRRFCQTPDGEPGLNYLCAAYKRFFTHASPHFEMIARAKQGTGAR